DLRVSRQPCRGRPDPDARRDHLPRQALGHHRVERPGEPDVLRQLRLPDLLRLHQGQVREADDGGARGRTVGREHRHARGDGARRAGDARVRPVGHHGEELV
ncbi:MAG: ATP-dependent Clp protease adaptor protein ClpS, partial [uncultured Nocardioides sp.]